MTAIISNGHFLVADRRMTTGFDQDSSMFSGDGFVARNSRNDNGVKIRSVLDDLDLVNSRGSVIAYAFSGNAKSFATFQEELDTRKGKVILNSLVKTISRWSPGNGARITAITDQAWTLKFTLGQPTVTEVKPGEISTCGSGGGAIDRFFQLYPGSKSDLSLEDCIILAAAGDPHSCRAYSAFSVEEKVIYSNCEVPLERAKARYSELLNKVLVSGEGFELFNTSISGVQ